MNNENRYLRVQDVANRYTIGVSTVWKLVAEDRMPQPRRIGCRTTRWALSDLEEWEANLLDPKGVSHG